VKKLRLGVLASGRGSNLQAIIDACEKPDFPAQVVVVISDNENAMALDRARKHGIAAVFVAPGKHKTWMEPEIERRMVSVLREHGVELVCLAGYMRVVKQTLLDAFPGRVINIHPALLPSFRGLEGQKQALEFGCKVAGCTVHFVEADVDTGPIICQAAVPVMEDDDVDALSHRILEWEHRIYPHAIRLIAEGRLRIEGRRVRIEGERGGFTG
jgi:phosphoribosylglycinamide formyltransferase-1